MNIRIGDWEIRPHRDGLCWEIWRFRDVVSRKDGSTSSKWVSEGSYPTTLQQALSTVYERMLKEDAGTCDLAGAIERAGELARMVRDAAGEDGR